MKLFLYAAAALLGCALLASLALRPVCVPISAEELAQFNVPIEQRDDRDLYLQVFQRRNGQWHQCKTWLSRQLFF
jgi:hypothetical protein